MEEKNKIVLFEQDKLISKAINSLRITNKILSISKAPNTLIPYRKGNKWGFCTPNKKIIIDCIFDKVSLFSEGLACVKKNDKWGYIDFSGNIRINIEYDEVKPFKEGLAAVYKNDIGWAFINLIGELIYSNFSYLNDFYEGFAAIEKDGKYGFIDKSGEIIIPIIYDCNYNNHRIRSYGYDKESNFYKFSEGFICLRKNEKYGFFDKTGKMIVPFIYDEAQQFSNGLAKVGVYYPNNNNYAKAGYINYSGILEIPLKYFFRYIKTPSFSDGLELVFEGDKGISNRFYINKNDEVIISKNNLDEFIYKDNFSEGLALVMKNFKYGYINKNGLLVIPCIYNSAHEFSEGLSTVYTNNGGEFINVLGQRAIEKTYPKLSHQKFKNDLCLIRYFHVTHMSYDRPQLEGYINKEGTQYWED